MKLLFQKSPNIPHIYQYMKINTFHHNTSPLRFLIHTTSQIIHQITLIYLIAHIGQNRTIYTFRKITSSITRSHHTCSYFIHTMLFHQDIKSLFKFKSQRWHIFHQKQNYTIHHLTNITIMIYLPS